MPAGSCRESACGVWPARTRVLTVDFALRRGSSVTESAIRTAMVSDAQAAVVDKRQ